MKELLEKLGAGMARSTFWLIAFPWFATAGLYAMTWLEKDVSGLTGPLGILVGAVYGGGAVKAWAKYSNGGSGSSPPSR